MTWFGRLVGIIGYRTIQNGSHLVKPPRIFGVLPNPASRTPPPPQQQQQQQPQSDGKFDQCHITTSHLSYRSFWTWRGGDDKKWKYDKEKEDETEDNSEVASVAIKEAKHKQQLLLSPSAYPVSVCTAQGFRSYMEDEFFLSMDGDFAAVFDGHGGPAVSKYLRKNLYANVQAHLPVLTTTTTTTTSSDMVMENTEPSGNETKQEQPMKRLSSTVEDYENALASALDKVDREVQRIIHWSYQGSTAVAIWIHEERITSNNNDNGDEDGSSSSTSSSETVAKKSIIAANVGDSRAVLCRNGTAWDLTRDHKPDDPLEKSRIEALGGQVVWCGDRDKLGEPILERGIYRVNGNLALSRAIGDRSERPAVTAEPEIISVPVMEGVDDFIILATDGLWDVFDSDEAVDFVSSLRQDGHQVERISTLVVEEALRRGTYDNITVVIIWLDRSPDAKSN